MQRKLLLAALALFCACDPKIENTPPTTVITARFDPSAAVPVVPTPNDLAFNADTQLLAVSVPPTATDADRAFYAYLNQLNGFPASATAQATFDGDLQPSSVTATGVRVFDVTAQHSAVTDATIAYVDTDVDAVKGTVTVAPPPTGWVPGHTYAVALLSGPGRLAGKDDVPVKGSATWAFIRSSKELVTCGANPPTDCVPTTEIIPSAEKEDPAARYADQTAKSLQLEQLRLKYKPTVDKLVGDGVKREDIVLVWTFKITDFTQVIFDPTNRRIPTPNDLLISTQTGLVNIPIDPAYTDAYKEFISDYLNTLDGFPVSSAASIAVGGDLDAATVTDKSVLVLPIDNEGPLSGPPNVSWNATTKSISVAPPNGSWGKGRQLAIVVLGRQQKDRDAMPAPDAVTTPGGGAVVASSVWALVRSAGPLVECPMNDLTSPECKRTITAAPLTDGQAIQLEQLRRSYAPVLDAVVAQGRSREDVALAFTFRTVSLPEATFDPSASIIPFPNNVLRTQPPNPRLNLPVPDGGSALQRNLVIGLNTLDGFSLTAPIVSESSETRGALDFGAIDPESLDAGTGFLRLGLGTQPRVTKCLDCASSLLPDGGAPATPQQLQFVPQIPLEEQATYGAYLTTGLRDLDGHRVIPSGPFALARLSAPLCDASMKSTVPVLSDLQACGAGGAPGLEQLRAGLKPFIDALVGQGLPRRNIALAWAFTTQSTVSELTTLAAAVAMGSLPTTVTAGAVPRAAVMPMSLPQNNLAANLYIGTLTVPHALTGPGGVIVPPNLWSSRKAAYMMTVPSGTAPMNGWPVVIFGHGLTSNRTTMLAISNALAGVGFATIAIDVVWHGERTTCIGAGAALAASIPNATDDYACASPSARTMPDPVNNRCDQMTGRCVVRMGTGTACVSDVQCMALNEGYCLPSGFCEGADFTRAASGAPLVNAHNFLNLGNLFAARDNFRHYALDLTQVVRLIKADAFLTAGGPDLDGTTIHYVGQSLGGFNGTLFAAVDPDVQHVTLNVPGSDQTQVLLTSPGFASVRNGFLGQLAPLGITPGTPQFDQLMVLIRTIFDRADPQNYALTAVNRNVPATRRVFIQEIINDFVVPNPTTEKLIAAASSGMRMPFVERVNPTLVPEPGMGGMCSPMPGQLCPSGRHGFLLNFTDPTTTAAAQTKVANFVQTGVVP